MRRSQGKANGKFSVLSSAGSVGCWATSHWDVTALLQKACGGRWCPVGTVQRLVSAAASVGDGRSPLGCITRVGRREGGRAPKVLKQSAALQKRQCRPKPARAQRAIGRRAGRFSKSRLWTVRALVYGPSARYDNGPTFLSPAAPVKAARRCLALCKPFEKGLSENFSRLRRFYLPLGGSHRTDRAKVLFVVLVLPN